MGGGCARLILQQESEAARGAVQLLVKISLQNSKEVLRITAHNPISLTTYNLELRDNFSHLFSPPEGSCYTDLTYPVEDAALSTFCSRLRLVNMGQVRAEPAGQAAACLTVAYDVLGKTWSWPP